MRNKIVFFIRSLHVGGAEKQSIILAEELSKRYNVFLVVLYKEGKLISSIKNPKIVYFLEGSFLKKIIQFYAFLRREKITHIFNFLPINNILGTLVGKLVGVSFIYTGIRGSKIKSSIFKMKLQLFLSNTFAYRVVSNSHRAKETYSDYGYKRSKIDVIHNMMVNLPTVSFIKENNIRKNKVNKIIKILTVGRFVDEKDYPTMIKSIRQFKNFLKDSNFIWELDIVGYGLLEKEILSLVKTAGLIENINFFKGDEINVKEKYIDSDIYLSSSKFEGMSNTIMEAMSLGLPIVATDAGDSSYLVKNEVNGYLYDVGDYLGISRGLFKLMQSQELRFDFGLKGHSLLGQNYSKQNIIEKYKSLIEL